MAFVYLEVLVTAPWICFGSGESSVLDRSDLAAISVLK